MYLVKWHKKIWQNTVDAVEWIILIRKCDVCRYISFWSFSKLIFFTHKKKIVHTLCNLQLSLHIWIIVTLIKKKEDEKEYDKEEEEGCFEASSFSILTLSCYLIKENIFRIYSGPNIMRRYGNDNDPSKFRICVAVGMNEYCNHNNWAIIWKKKKSPLELDFVLKHNNDKVCIINFTFQPKKFVIFFLPFFRALFKQNSKSLKL